MKGISDVVDPMMPRRLLCLVLFPKETLGVQRNVSKFCAQNNEVNRFRIIFQVYC